MQTKSWRWAALGYTVLMLVLLSPLILHRVEPIWDALDMGYPAFTYLADAVREGRYPLWDPYTNCGVPFHADGFGLAINPVAILLGLTIPSTALGFIWFWVFYWWLGGFGMIWLARHFGASPVGACVTAVTYALSGFFIGGAEFTVFFVFAGCFPWVLFFADRAVMRSSWLDAVLAGVALGFSTLAGYPGFTPFGGLVLAFWLALRYLPSAGLATTDTRSRGRRALWIGITLSLVAVVSVVVWLPALQAFLTEGRGYTDRADPLPKLIAVTSERFTWKALLSLFFPYTTVTGRPWMGADIPMTNAYMGMVTIPLVIWWVWTNGWRKTWWLVVFSLCLFEVSLGGQFGLRSLLYELYPPTQYMRLNAPFRLFWILPLCLAAGLGFTQLLSQSQPTDRRRLLQLLGLWSLGAVGAVVVHHRFAAMHGIAYGDQLFRLFGPGSMVLVIVILFLWFWGRHKHPLPKAVPTSILAIVIFADMGGHLYTNQFTVWRKTAVTKQVEHYHCRSTRIEGHPPPRTPKMPYRFFNAHQIVKVFLVKGYVVMRNKGFDEVLTRSTFVSVLSGPYRFWLSPGVEPIQSPEEALSQLSAIGSDQPVPVLVENQIPGLGNGLAIPGQFGRVAIASYAPERIEMVIDVPGDQPAFLASTERYAVSWKAYVNGEPQPVERVNLYFRGIKVPPGQHAVVWVYEPRWWTPLVMLSFAVMAGTLLAAWLRYRRQSASATTAESSPSA